MLTSTDIHVEVATSSTKPWISNPSAGALRYNTVNNQLEVWDGYSWIIINEPQQTVRLSHSTTEVLNWAKKKMCEEAELEALAAKYPGVQDLKEKLEIMITLVREQENSTNK